MKSTISPEPALLGFLLDGPLHGYDLYKVICAELGPTWHLGLSQMYAILNDYAARNWIRTRVELQGARPAKKMLELTPAGHAAFEAWLAQPARGLREFRVDFFARLYFARAAGSRPAQRLIDQQIAASRRELASLQARRKAAKPNADDFADCVRSFRIVQLTTIIKWLENNRAGLLPPQKRGRQPARGASRVPSRKK
jgi:DNA-binding PadR family transcriptional regulator